MADLSGKPQSFNPPGLPTPPPTYNHVAVTPLRPTSKLITIAVCHCLRPVKVALAAAGASPRDIIAVKHLVVKETGDGEVDKLEIVDRGWAENWTRSWIARPPDTVIGVAALAKRDALYEVEVWAIVHE